MDPAHIFYPPFAPGFIHFGFLELRWIDLLDIFLVGLLIHQVYRLLRGSLAYNIFIGFLIVYLLSLVFKALDMHLISEIMGQFVGVGVIALLIVFQPEVRRFLLYIGRGSALSRFHLLRRFNLRAFGERNRTADLQQIDNLYTSLDRMMRKKTGALIVFSQTAKLQFFAESGVRLDAQVSGKLLESIFQKNSPLHDGAVIISDRRIRAAACILPVSESTDLPGRLGLRHRAAVGITEHSDAIALVISEENGKMGYARAGQWHPSPGETEIRKLLLDLWAGSRDFSE